MSTIEVITGGRRSGKTSRLLESLEKSQSSTLWL